MKTINEVKDYLKKNFEQGTTCPCCGQFVKAYKRSFNANMARALALINKLSNQGKNYIHVQKEFQKYKLRATSMDYIQLERWNMIKPDTDNNGYWTITSIGISFLENKIQVADFVLVYNNKTYAYSSKNIYLKDIIYKKFSYEELFNFKK